MCDGYNCRRPQTTNFYQEGKDNPKTETCSEQVVVWSQGFHELIRFFGMTYVRTSVYLGADCREVGWVTANHVITCRQQTR